MSATAAALVDPSDTVARSSTDRGGRVGVPESSTPPAFHAGRRCGPGRAAGSPAGHVVGTRPTIGGPRGVGEGTGTGEGRIDGGEPAGDGAPAAAPEKVVVSRQAWFTLAIASAAAFMVALEVTVISLALPEIQDAFPGTEYSALSWIFNAYSIGVASLLLVAGLGVGPLRAQAAVPGAA